MIARLYLQPEGLAEEAAALASVLEGLTSVNVVWMRSMVAAGRAFPCCPGCGGILYVPWHGSPLGRERQYLDAPTLLRAGRGTCADVAAYYAAARRVLDSEDTRIRIARTGPNTYHAVVDIRTDSGWRTVDPSEELAAVGSRSARAHQNHDGCGCGAGG